MRRSRKLIIGAAVAAAGTLGLGTAALATGGTHRLGTVATTTVAATTGTSWQLPVAYRPISADAPFDTPIRSTTCAPWPAVATRPGTDYAHLPRWAHGRYGAAILREDRVNLHRVYGDRYCYTNINPRLHNYRLDPRATITVSAGNYYRMTGRQPANWARHYRVSRQQFLDSYHVRPNQDGWYQRYSSVYRLSFDRTGTRVVRIDEVEAGWQYGTCGC
jgi:hypothetical protein